VNKNQAPGNKYDEQRMRDKYRIGSQGIECTSFHSVFQRPRQTDGS